MKMLSDLVDIRSGYTFRTAIDSYGVGDTKVIQAKDLGSYFSTATLPEINFPGDDNHLLRPGDVLVSARGFSKAVLFQDASTKAVASSSLFVLHPKDSSVNPEFIAMFFNSSVGMKAMFELSSGASVRTITKDNIGQIGIPEIPPDKERALGRVVQSIDDHLLLTREKEIYLNNMRESIIIKTLKETAV